MLLYYNTKDAALFDFDSLVTQTDYSYCCWLHPKLDMESGKKAREYTSEDYLGVPRGTRSGIKNGVKLILDVEGE